jgi:hypothetical protein
MKTKFKRFIVFTHARRYPSGGMSDFQDDFDYADQAKGAALESLKKFYKLYGSGPDPFTTTVFDCQRQTIILKVTNDGQD